MTICTISTAAAAGGAKTLARTADPVVVSGEKLKGFQGFSIHELRLYAYADGDLKAVPFQVDERDAKGGLVFPLGPKGGRDADVGLLDGNDELVFMAKDSGGRAPETKRPGGAGAAAEIELADPLTGGKAWVYLFHFRKPPAPAAGDYASITKDGGVVSTTNFTMTFSKEAPIGFDKLILKPAGGGNGKNGVDRLKVRADITLRMVGVTIHKNENNFESELVAFIDGPVRVVRRTSNKMFFFWKIASPATTVDNVFYFNSFEFPTEVTVPFDIGALASEFRFRVITDGNRNQKGKKFLNEKNLKPVTFDGVMSDEEKKLDTSPYKWSAAYGTAAGDTGAWINRLEFEDDIEAVPRLYYMDDVKAELPPEKEPGQIGALGYDVVKMETVKKGVWRLTSSMYNTPEYSPGAEKEFLDIKDHPLEVKVR